MACTGSSPLPLALHYSNRHQPALQDIQVNNSVMVYDAVFIGNLPTCGMNQQPLSLRQSKNNKLPRELAAPYSISIALEMGAAGCSETSVTS
jgi:hypothetical protein